VADEEQLRILKQGSEAWDAWRAQAGQTPIIRRADLRGANLSRASLTEAKFINTNLCETNLSRAARKASS
jgi:uncharacterized protein YjbI with pentapeptide repeats